MVLRSWIFPSFKSCSPARGPVSAQVLVILPTDALKNSAHWGSITRINGSEGAIRRSGEGERNQASSCDTSSALEILFGAIKSLSSIAVKRGGEAHDR